MSSLGKKDDVVKIKEIQQLFLSSLLGADKTVMPRWAWLEKSPVDRVAVVLLKYVTAKMFSQNEECMPNLSEMFDVVGSINSAKTIATDAKYCCVDLLQPFDQLVA